MRMKKICYDVRLEECMDQEHNASSLIFCWSIYLGGNVNCVRSVWILWIANLPQD